MPECCEEDGVGTVRCVVRLTARDSLAAILLKYSSCHPPECQQVGPQLGLLVQLLLQLSCNLLVGSGDLGQLSFPAIASMGSKSKNWARKALSGSCMLTLPDGYAPFAAGSASGVAWPKPVLRGQQSGCFQD